AGERALAHLEPRAGALRRILHGVVAVGVVPAVEHELVLALDALEQLGRDALVAGAARDQLPVLAQRALQRAVRDRRPDDAVALAVDGAEGAHVGHPEAAI